MCVYIVAIEWFTTLSLQKDKISDMIKWHMTVKWHYGLTSKKFKSTQTKTNKKFKELKSNQIIFIKNQNILKVKNIF